MSTWPKKHSQSWGPLRADRLCVRQLVLTRHGSRGSFRVGLAPPHTLFKNPVASRTVDPIPPAIVVWEHLGRGVVGNGHGRMLKHGTGSSPEVGS
jgi:hypothetical protein